MRLLNFDIRGELTLTKNFDEKDIPCYAILSHTWGADEEEVTFDDLRNGYGKNKPGYAKIWFCVEQARKDGLQYFWVDTCCIDKANHTELSEAITSMIRWYHDSVKCYVYLSDVPVRNEENNQTKHTWESAFRKSRWFTRGWTLQELIAPRSVEFFSWKGEYLGNKNTLERQIQEITEIPIGALRGAPLSTFSVDERMRWAENRKTQKKEDKAHCLLGIFNVFMPLIYGEGENAFVRLKAEIDSASRNTQISNLLDRIPRLDYQDLHHNLQLTRMEGAGQWILDMQEFIEWRDGPTHAGTLWCNGGPGVGKTYITSVVIDHLEEISEQRRNAVLYLYFDYRKQSDQTPLKVLQTLLHQLLSAHSYVPLQASQLRERLDGGKGLPGWKELKSAFINLCNSASDLFIVFDALDECDVALNRGPIVELIREIKTSRARLLVTSRPYPPDIDQLLGDCKQLMVEASDSDIRAYLLDQIARSTQLSPIIDKTLRDEIVASVGAKSQGMFLLPALQIQNILGQTNKAQMRKALEALPVGLADNLAITIERIKAQHAQSHARANLALAVLQWLSTVQRPITTNELQHALACTPGGLQVDDLTHPTFFVDCCFGLVIIDKETSIVRLVHFSVNEFLQEKREELFKNPDGALAVTCLPYILNVVLSHHDADIERKFSDSLTFFPLKATWHLFDYAAAYWGHHVEKGHDAQVETTLREFLSHRAAVQFWRQYLAKLVTGYYNYGEKPPWVTLARHVEKDTTTLHIAAIYGILQLADRCLKEPHVDVNERDGVGATPLMRAAALGRVNIMALLSSRGIPDVNAQDGSGSTALGYAVEASQLPSVLWLLSSCDLDINAGDTLMKAFKNVGEKYRTASIYYVCFSNARI